MPKPTKVSSKRTKEAAYTKEQLLQQAQEKFGMSKNAAEVFIRRYVRKADKGFAETVEETFRRVVNNVADADKYYNQDPRESQEVFYESISNFEFVPNSPTWTGAGTPLGQLAACFVLPIKDDLGRDPEGIFSTLRVAALIQQTGGGNGFSFSRLRPKNDFVSRSGGRSSGPVGFLEAYDSAFGVIAQGGTRRGANMAVLRVDHPDIRDFIHCKEKEGSVSNFNISVAATDKFMKAVKEGKKFELVNPRNGEVVETVDARELFDEITTSAHRNGEPGILFIDAANRENPVPQLYELEATNPCGEQWLGPFENCCLGHINLAKCVADDDRVDWQKLREITEVGTKFLDNVVDANNYVPEVPALREAALNVRRIGLGFMGLADMMYNLNVRYNSDEGIELAAQIMEFIRYHSMKTSIERAKERGPFPAIKGSRYDSKTLKWEVPTPLYEYSFNFGRPELDWKRIEEGIKKYGIRNGTQTTIAPTGVTSTVADVAGSGCEPVFALSYIRHVVEGEGLVDLIYTNPLFEEALKEVGLEEEKREKIYAKVREKGSCQDIKELPSQIRRVFVVSQDITADDHVKIQSALQSFVDNSISKTCNFPEGADVQDVKDAYFKAWELGCKGLTVYVTGSRQQIVLETHETKKRREESAQAPPPQIKPRPHVVTGSTYKIKTPVGSAFVTINESGGEKEPLELFINVGRVGSDISADAEAIGRLSSLVLRVDPTMTPRKRVEAIVDQLSGIGGSRTVGFGKRRVRSLADGVAKVLEEYLGIIEPPVEDSPGQLPLDIKATTKLGDICSQCGEATLVNEEGCRKCYGCGYSEC